MRFTGEAKHVTCAGAGDPTVHLFEVLEVIKGEYSRVRTGCGLRLEFSGRIWWGGEEPPTCMLCIVREPP